LKCLTDGKRASETLSEQVPEGSGFLKNRSRSLVRSSAADKVVFALIANDCYRLSSLIEAGTAPRAVEAGMAPRAFGARVADNCGMPMHTVRNWKRKMRTAVQCGKEGRSGAE